MLETGDRPIERQPRSVVHDDLPLALDPGVSFERQPLNTNHEVRRDAVPPQQTDGRGRGLKAVNAVEVVGARGVDGIAPGPRRYRRLARAPPRSPGAADDSTQTSEAEHPD